MMQNPYYPQYPYPMPDQLAQLRTQYQPQQSGNIWVGSDQDAANYMVAPNSSVTLWNSNAPTIYLKQADASGKPSLRIYDLVERQIMPAGASSPQVEYVTRKDFDALVARVAEITSEKGAAE